MSGHVATLGEAKNMYRVVFWKSLGEKTKWQMKKLNGRVLLKRILHE